MLCLVQLSNEENPRPRMLKASLSERKLLNAILRVTLKYMKDVSFSWMKCICNAEDRFSCLELFLELRTTNALELRTLMLCLVQLSKWREARPGMLKSFLLSERKLLNAILRVRSSTWKMFLSHEMKCYLQCRRQIFMFRAFLRAKNTMLLELRTLMLF